MQVDGYSLDAQRDKLRKYAEYEDMVVAGEYSDEGFSGKNIQGRHEFQRMLQDIQDCKDGVEYVLVFKLSRFGRNAADVLNSLQLMQDFGVNLICVEDGIDSSKDSGKLMISVLSAVAEIERENIRTQTMAGREQKAREGKWNGGFAPYGYRLEKGELLIAEDEVDVIRTIFDRYIHTNDGVSGVAKYLNRQGFVKKLRQNGTIPGFSASFVKSIIDNPVYMGKIAYGRRRTEKKIGTRNEMHVVEQSEFPVYEGKHEAIISEEDWNLAQEKRKINAYRREKVNDPTHAHILSGILKCPCCGKSLYGNIAKAHSKDKKTRYYYYCKNTVTPTGHECTFRLNIEQMEMNRMVASIISAMVSDPRFADAIKAKIGSAVDTNDLEKQLEALQAQLRQTLGTKARLERQMDGLDVNDPYYDRKISDLQRRYDEQYGAIDEIEVQIDDVQSQIRSIRQEKISGDNIYRLLLAFDQVYEAASEVERKEFMRAFIERIELFPEKQPDGNWIRKIIFNFPVPVNGTEVKELPLENETIVEAIIVSFVDLHGGRLVRMERTAAHVVSPDPDAVICSCLRDGYAGLEGIVNSRIIHFLVFVGKKGIGSSVVLPCFAPIAFVGAALRQQPVDFIRAECPGQPVQFGSLLLHEIIVFCFSLPVRGFSEHIVVLLALVDQQGIDLSQLADEFFDDRESLVCAVAFGGFQHPGVGKKLVCGTQALYECFDLFVALRKCIYLPFCGFDFMLSLLPIRLRQMHGLLRALLLRHNRIEGFLFLHDLELHGGQVLLGAAAFAALHVGVARSEHGVVVLILQNAVGFLQDNLACFRAHGLSEFVQHRLGLPLLAVADLHDDLLDGADQRWVLAALRPQNLLFDDGHIDHVEMIVPYVVAEGFAHALVALVGMHDGGENVLLAADNIDGGSVRFGVKRLRKLVAAVIVEIRGVDIENQLVVVDGILLETSGGNGAVLLHLPKHVLIAAGRFLGMDVQVTAFGNNVLVPVTGFLALVMGFGIGNVAFRSGLVADGGAVHAIVSCPGSASFLSWV